MKSSTVFLDEERYFLNAAAFSIVVIFGFSLNKADMPQQSTVACPLSKIRESRNRKCEENTHAFLLENLH